jgi:hypothetical protein
MIRRYYVVALTMLCALVLSAVAANSAAAEQRAYTCSTGAVTKEFSDAHCLTKAEPKAFGHTLISKANSKITVTNGKTASGTTTAAITKLKGTLVGVESEIQCTNLSGSGLLTNAESSATLTGVVEFTGCSVTKPAGKGCVVTGGAITTKTIKATTVGQAANKLKFMPNEGTEFTTIPIEKCTIEGLNNKFPVTGSATGDLSGATVSETHLGTTTQNTLKFGGVKAGIEGAMTISGEGSGVIEVDEGVTLTSAVAEQRAYTCSKSASSKEFSDAHCATKSAGEYGHTLISEENTKWTATSEKTASGTTAAETAKLKGQLSGIATEVQCTSSHGTGTLTNSVTSASGSGTIKYTGCTVTVPSGKGCKVEGGAITTETLSATTAGQTTGTLKLSPKSPATRFALVSIEGCTEGLPADGFYPITGSAVAELSGATIKLTHANTTTQNTLKFGGVKAGIEGSLTLSKEGGDPIAFTAVNEQGAYACSKSAASKTFADAHCLTGGGAYGHTLITKEKQEVSFSNGKTTGETTAAEIWKLKGVLGGVTTEVQCKGASGTGTLTNAAGAVNGEGVIKYTECTVTVPAGKGCKLEGGAVTTETLSATTAGQAANTIKLSPKSGTKFAQIPIEGCEGGVPPEAVYSITGTVVAEVSGATIKTNHANTTTQNTLKFGGVKAGIEGAVTVTRKGTEEVPGSGAITFT